MELTLRLLGQVNEHQTPGSTVLRRYIATVTSETLSHLLAYERTGSRNGIRWSRSRA